MFGHAVQVVVGFVASKDTHADVFGVELHEVGGRPDDLGGGE
jgi:hypothetical protein